MKNIFVLNKSRIASKSLVTFAAVCAAVALPQVFHWLGLASGLGNGLGAAFLPMHIPVFIAAFMAGPAVGLAAGVLSPLVSFGISGMPTGALLPFMVIELAGYGLIAGFLYKSKTPVFVNLIIAQLAGRVLRAGAVLVSVYALESGVISVQSIWNTITAGLPGILLQMALIPLLMYRIRGLKERLD